MRGLSRWQTNRRGSTAIEFAFAAPVVLLIVFGIMEVSRMAWTQVTLERAVGSAARCAALHTPSCSEPADIAKYGADSATVLTIPEKQFEVSDAACGVRVGVSLPFKSLIVFGDEELVTLTAEACVPSRNEKSP